MVEVRSVTFATLLQVPLPFACTACSGSALTLGLDSESLALCGGEPGTSRPARSPRGQAGCGTSWDLPASGLGGGQPGPSRVYLSPFTVTFVRHLTSWSQCFHLQKEMVVSFSAGLET